MAEILWLSLAGLLCYLSGYFGYVLGKREGFNEIAKYYIVFDKHTVIGAIRGDCNEKDKPTRTNKKTSR